MKTVLLFAMKEEAKETIESFNLKKIESNSFLALDIYEGEISGEAVALGVLGHDERFGVSSIGTVPAALAAAELIRIYQPKILINPGTAGGFKSRGGNIGDIYLPTKVLFHHREIPFENYQAYGEGSYETNLEGELKNLDCKFGVFSASDSLTCSEREMKFFNKNEVVVKDMESAAIAYVCERSSTKYVGVKSITDIVDGDIPTAEEFSTNLKSASNSLQSFLKLKLKDLLS